MDHVQKGTGVSSDKQPVAEAVDAHPTSLAPTSRRRFLVGSAIAAALPALVGAGLRVRPAVAASGKTLVVGIGEGALRTLDPNNANEVEFMVIAKNIYDSLVTFSGPALNQVEPDMASKWTASDDGLTYTFDLDPRVKFSDGSPVTPEDVVFGLRRQINLKGPGAYFLDSVKDINKSGPNQVRFELNDINVDMLAILVTPSLMIAKAADIKANGGTDGADASTTDTARAWLDTHSAGSGPFVLDSWTRGTQLVLKRNVNYWGPPAPVDTVIFRFVSDPTTQRNLLQRGDIHIAASLTPDLAAAIQGGSGNLAIATVPSFGVGFFNVNAINNPVFKSPKIWEALKRSIDYDGMQKIYQGGGQFTGSIVPPGIPNALPVSERQTEDLVAAKAALKAGGYPNGFEFKLTYASDEIMQNIPAADIAQKLRDDFQRVGLTANLEPVPYSEELTRHRAAKFEADLHFFGVDYPGWTDYLPLFAPGGGVAGRRNAYTADFSPEAREIADLTAKAIKTVDLKQQSEYVLEAQRKLNQTGPFAWLFETNLQIGYRKDVIKNLPTNPIWYFDVGKIEMA
jgi:peptide/nickel transport system substrate-binding protein